MASAGTSVKHVTSYSIRMMDSGHSSRECAPSFISVCITDYGFVLDSQLGLGMDEDPQAMWGQIELLFHFSWKD